MSKIKKLIFCAVCVSFCVVLPMALHAVPGVGSLISPMHIPVFLCGLICGPVWGGVCGIMGPLLSCVLTQMPAAAYMPVMAVELFFYGLISGVGMKLIKTGKYYANVYISLGVAMIAGRLLAGVAQALVFSVGSYSLEVFVSSYFAGTLPGMAVHLILVPAVISALRKARIVK
ncbi:MAG: ECF transporter S component [Clostridia bacterium]|nr:ECF transporter S component [Clostridia bacterium]